MILCDGGPPIVHLITIRCALSVITRHILSTHDYGKSIRSSHHSKTNCEIPWILVNFELHFPVYAPQVWTPELVHFCFQVRSEWFHIRKLPSPCWSNLPTNLIKSLARNGLVFMITNWCLQVWKIVFLEGRFSIGYVVWGLQAWKGVLQGSRYFVSIVVQCLCFRFSCAWFKREKSFSFIA